MPEESHKRENFTNNAMFRAKAHTRIKRIRLRLNPLLVLLNMTNVAYKHSRHTERKRSIPLNFVNNAILRFAQEGGIKHVIVSDSEIIQPVVNQNQLQENKYAPTSKSKISVLPQGVDISTNSLAPCGRGKGEGLKVAFTLAEVLITLGIIGVVAALTLPTLIQNHQKTVLENQLKREISVISNNFRKILADEEVDKLADTSLFDYGDEVDWVKVKDIEAVRKCFNAEYVSDNSEFGKFINKYLGRDMYGRKIRGMSFKDGSCMAFFSYGEGDGGSSVSLDGALLLDVNCDKSPNKIGRDIFTIFYSNYGVLDGVGDEETANGFCNNQYLNMDPNEMNFVHIVFVGASCYSKIVLNNWKMDY